MLKSTPNPFAAHLVSSLAIELPAGKTVEVPRCMVRFEDFTKWFRKRHSLRHTGNRRVVAGQIREAD